MRKEKDYFAVTENGKRVKKGTYEYPKFDDVDEAIKVLGTKDVVKLINDGIKKFSRDLAAEQWKAKNLNKSKTSINGKLYELWKQGKLDESFVTLLKSSGYKKPEDLLRKTKKSSERVKLITKLRKAAG